MSEATESHIIERISRGLVIGLVVQFILGFLLTTVVNYNPSRTTAMQETVLVLHIIVAIALAPGAVTLVAITRRQRQFLWPSLVGAASVAAAYIAGLVAAHDTNDVAVLIMGLGALAAVLSYGFVLLLTATTGWHPVHS